MKLKHFIILITLFSLNSFSQNGIWVTFEDLSILPQEQNGRLVSSSTDLQNIIDTYSVHSVKQILPASKQEHLQRVYEMSCDCFVEDLIKTVQSSGLPMAKPEPAPEYELLYEPNDLSMAFSNDYAMELINAQYAWDITHGSNETVIAISDSNFDLDHDELVGTYTYYESPNSNTNYHHGTAVAILAAGNTDNNSGKSSIGFDCSLALYTMDFNSLLIATYDGVRVINVSWAVSCFYNSYYQEVIDEVYENGTVIVAAAGNGGTCGTPDTYVYPAALDHVISVTSVGPWDNHERVIGDSNSTHQHNDMVDICAPGYDVPLSIAGNIYMTGNGTSFAAPIVTGTIGLMLTVNPNLTPDDIMHILSITAVNIDSLNPAYAGLLGDGRLNAGAAVAMALTYEPNVLNTNDDYTDNWTTSGMNPVSDDSNASLGSVEETVDTKIDLFPNPSNGSSMLKWNSDKVQNVSIYDSKGSMVSNHENITGNSLLIENLNSGVFLVILHNEDGILEKKKLVVL